MFFVCVFFECRAVLEWMATLQDVNHTWPRQWVVFSVDAGMGSRLTNQGKLEKKNNRERHIHRVNITWHKNFLFETTVVMVKYFFRRSCQALMMTIMYEVQWNDRTSAAWDRISFDRHYSLAAFENTTLVSSVRNNIISVSELKSATPGCVR